jgi:tRNA(Ile)-lysidine synthase
VPVTSPSTRLLSRATFPPAGTPVACAVSGGADSLALLVLAVEAGCGVTAVHVDHGLRPGSGAEADVVRDAAARVGAAFVAERAEVAPGANLEARARAARYAALPPGALTGHTADDQAETVLLNLLRGAGVDGLAGIRPGPTKPLLALRRHETRALCDDVGLVPVEDPSNDDLSLRRNRVRHELLPLLDAIGERDVVAVVARQAAHLAADDDLLDQLAAAIDPSDARALNGAPPPLARRAVRRWLRAGCDHPPDAATVERVLAVARGEARATDVGAGRSVRRSAMRLTLA